MGRGTRRLLLVGASALAILTAAGEANAVTYSIPGFYEYMAPASGFYSVLVDGASGGDSPGGPGGPGAEVTGVGFVTGGDFIQIVVGGQGRQGSAIGNFGSGGGGGLSYAWSAQFLAVAGGGGGAGNSGGGGSGLATPDGDAGRGSFGGAGGSSTFGLVGYGGYAGRGFFGGGGGGVAFLGWGVWGVLGDGGFLGGGGGDSAPRAGTAWATGLAPGAI